MEKGDLILCQGHLFQVYDILSYSVVLITTERLKYPISFTWVGHKKGYNYYMVYREIPYKKVESNELAVRLLKKE